MSKPTKSVTKPEQLYCDCPESTLDKFFARPVDGNLVQLRGMMFEWINPKTSTTIFCVVDYVTRLPGGQCRMKLIPIIGEETP